MRRCSIVRRPAAFLEGSAMANHVKRERQRQVVAMLVEGSSIWSIERMTSAVSSESVSRGSEQENR